MTALLDSARLDAERAAVHAGVRLREEHEVQPLNRVAQLLGEIWGGLPVPADLLCSMAHAGSSIISASTLDGQLCGAAVAIASPGGRDAYSLVAGVRSGFADAGIGFALKLRQRAWALARGIDTICWTFDPLIGRNARFNLSKLGATAGEYLPDFYGPLDDGFNAGDETDRLVAVWRLSGSGATAELPAGSKVIAHGPDGQPSVRRSEGALWCRVPADILALRRDEPALAAAWRAAVRDALTAAFARGMTATGMNRDGWYRLEERA